MRKNNAKIVSCCCRQVDGSSDRPCLLVADRAVAGLERSVASVGMGSISGNSYRAPPSQYTGILDSWVLCLSCRIFLHYSTQLLRHMLALFFVPTVFIFIHCSLDEIQESSTGRRSAKFVGNFRTSPQARSWQTVHTQAEHNFFSPPHRSTQTANLPNTRRGGHRCACWVGGRNGRAAVPSTESLPEKGRRHRWGAWDTPTRQIFSLLSAD